MGLLNQKPDHDHRAEWTRRDAPTDSRIPENLWPPYARWLHWCVSRWPKRVERCHKAPVSYALWQAVGEPGGDPEPYPHPRPKKTLRRHQTQHRANP